MYAMILAAGKGERMRPLSLYMPKPLLQAAGKPLLQYHLEALAAAGIRDVVINTARLGHMIEARFGSGSSLGLNIEYSHEGEEPLGTGGGIRKVLPVFGGSPFVLVNGDVWTDLDFSSLPLRPPGLAHLVMVENPDHNPQGDFALVAGQVTMRAPDRRLTYSGIGVYRPDLFTGTGGEPISFVPLLKQAISAGQVSGEFHSSRWFDIGTPERLEALDRLLRQRAD